MSTPHRILHLLLIGALALFASQPSAKADKRIALVIGNSAYQHAGILPNPANDATAMGALLKTAGFTVDVRRDLGVSEMRRALGDFSEAARDADMAVVFYAGHGIEVDGTNYMIPVDAKLAREFDVEDETVSLDRILRSIEPAKRLRFVILDACRDSPFVKTMRRVSRSVNRGLARVENTTPDTLVAFATEAGTVAQDGDTANSPFTSALLKYIATPGLDLRLAFGRVRDEVIRSTASKQRPFIYGSLGGSTVAIVDDAAPAAPGLVSAPPPPPAVDPCSLAEAHWKSAEAIGTKVAYEDHLARFGSCAFVSLAAARIAALNNSAHTQTAAQQQKAAETLARTARKQAEDTERKRLAALPPTERSRSTGGLDGSWTVTRSMAPGCGPAGSVFTIHVRGNTVSGPGGSGSISASGGFRIAGLANTFVGTLRGGSGSGTYSGRCSGTFTARKN